MLYIYIIWACTKMTWDPHPAGLISTHKHLLCWHKAHYKNSPHASVPRHTYVHSPFPKYGCLHFYFCRPVCRLANVFQFLLSAGENLGGGSTNTHFPCFIISCGVPNWHSCLRRAQEASPSGFQRSKGPTVGEGEEGRERERRRGSLHWAPN